MMTLRRRDERGLTKTGWLDSRHSFSFGGFRDPDHMGFRSLRVINEDRVIPGAGFPQHGHRDMEIISYVLEGELAHKDTLGTSSVIRPGDIQRMSAGTGIQHSEFNASQKDAVHFLQIWIMPERGGIPAGYEQRSFPAERQDGKLQLVASHDGRDGTVTIHQDVTLYRGVLADGDKVDYALPSGRHAWLQVARGQVKVRGEVLKEGDGAAFSGDPEVTIEGESAAEFLLFDLA